MFKGFLRKSLILSTFLVGTASIHDYLQRKTPQPPSIPVPYPTDTAFECTPSWLSLVMGFPIKTTTVTPFQGEGFISKCFKVNYTREDDQPGKLFAKYYYDALEKLPRRIFWLLSGRMEGTVRKEAYFFSHIQGFLNSHGINTPKVYYNEVEDHGQRSGLFYLLGFTSKFRGLFLFEDLSHMKCYGMYSAIPEHVAEATFKKLAQLHSLNWNTKRFDPDLENNVYKFFFNFEPNWYTKFPNKEGLTKFFSKLEKEVPLLSDPELRSAMYTLSEHYPELSKKYWHQKPMTEGNLFKNYTLLHGDLHSGNIFYQFDPTSKDGKELKDIVLIDWQGYGYGDPACEVASLLFNIDTFDDLSRDSRLLRVYYDELTKTVPTETYPFSVFEREVEIRMMGYISGTAVMVLKSNDDDNDHVDFTPLRQRMVRAWTKFQSTVEKWDKNNVWNKPDSL